MIWVIIKTLFWILLILKFIVSLTNVRCKSKVCLVGKTALITGGNAGLGLEVAKQLASRGCAIIIADKDDATNNIQKLIKETHNPNISAKIVDFASFKSVRLFAKELTQSVQKLHILVNNAGIGDMSFVKTEDDIQKIMQINYFSHFLLTHLLLELLLRSAPSRIIYSSSIAAYCVELLENNLNSQHPRVRNLLSVGSYGDSKLAGAIMSRILAIKLKDTGLTSNTYHPGLVKTNIWNSIRQLKQIAFYSSIAWTFILGKNPEEGVQTLLHLACANEVESVTGKFFMECTPVWQPKQVYDIDFCNRIWELSEKYVKLKPEEKLETVLQQFRSKN